RRKRACLMAAMSKRRKQWARSWRRRPRLKELPRPRLIADIIGITAGSRPWRTPLGKAACNSRPCRGVGFQPARRNAVGRISAGDKPAPQWELFMAKDRGEGRQDGLEERVVKIRRCAAVVKGGRR